MAQLTGERRSQPRQAYRAEVHYRLARFCTAAALELSEGGTGISIAAAEPLEAGTKLELFLINRNVQINGVVRDAELLPDGHFRIGVAFEKPEQELVAVLLAAEAARRR